MSGRRCIICGKDKPGLEVREDHVIQFIRWFKKNVTKNEKGYTLVVCKECYPQYAKERKRFERRRMLYLAIGVLFALVLIVASGGSALSIVYSIAVLVFMYLLALMSYTPALNTNTPVAKAR